MISIHRLIYNGYSSEDFNLCCQFSFDSDNGASDSYLSRSAVMSETYRGDMQRTHSYKYDSTLAPTITFMDKNFGEFDLDRQRKIMKWLTSKDTPSFLTVYHDDSEVVSYELLGAWTEVNTYKLGNGRVVGFQCKFSSISPFAFSPLKTIEKDVSNPSDNTITVNLETDDIQSAVYPRITIRQKNSIIVDVDKYADVMWVDGTVYYDKNQSVYYWVDKDGTRHDESSNGSNFKTTSVCIRNIHTDDRGNSQAFEATVKNNVVNETIVLDGANRVVSSSSTRIFGDDFSWQWLPLYEGNNELAFIGNCSVTLEYRTPIKCGEF